MGIIIVIFTVLLLLFCSQMMKSQDIVGSNGNLQPWLFCNFILSLIITS